MSAASKLTRTLVAMAKAAGCLVRAESESEQPWASATFIGAMHVLAIEGEDMAVLDAWLDTLVGVEFALPGHVVVDVTVKRQARSARVTALTLVTARAHYPLS